MLSRKAKVTTLVVLTLSSPLVVSLPLVEKRLSFSSHVSQQSPLDVWDPSLRQLSVIHGRSLVDDTLRGLLGGLSIIPGTVELSNLLLGDGKTSKGLLGSLGGLLLDVTPSSSAANETSTDVDTDAGSGSQSNATAVKVATGESYGYSLVASKKQTSQVYLMPVRQADVVPDSSNTSIGDTDSSTSSKNDTVLVKMLVHAVQRDENPTLMCATYGASPPTDLDVAPCTAVNGSTDDQTPSSGATAEAEATGAKQLFKYNRKTGELSPMFDDVPVAEAQNAVPSSTNSTEPDTTTSDPTQQSTAAASTTTPLTEMRMHFKASIATDGNNKAADDQPDQRLPTPDSSNDDHDCSDDADDDAQDTTSSEDPATAAVRITLGAVSL